MRKGLQKIIGLPHIKELAHIDISACQVTKETFPHTLIWGRGGTGKTFLGHCIAEEIGYFFIEKEAAALRSRENILELLIECDQRSKDDGRILLLFLDECHRLTERQQEVFYFPMKEWRIDQGEGHWYHMRPFTLIAATTQIDRLDEHSFMARFVNRWRLGPYEDVFVAQMVVQQFDALELKYSPSVVDLIVSLCEGIPRRAERLIRKVRNHALSQNRWEVTEYDITRVLELYHCDLDEL